MIETSKQLLPLQNMDPYSIFKNLMKEEDYEQVENYEQVEDYAYIINDCQFQHSGTKACMSQMRTFPMLLLIHIARMYLDTMQQTDLLKYL
jgi:hypothetical protein